VLLRGEPCSLSKKKGVAVMTAFHGSNVAAPRRKYILNIRNSQIR
jgi:hypothetical protein